MRPGSLAQMRCLPEPLAPGRTLRTRAETNGRSVGELPPELRGLYGHLSLSPSHPNQGVAIGLSAALLPGGAVDSCTWLDDLRTGRASRRWQLDRWREW